MPLRVNNNIIALNTRRQLLINNRQLATRIERLSSGLRINRAADDAAGLSVSEGMRAELGGFRQAVRNAEQGTNLIQTAEGALNEVSAILIRMRELAVQSASSTLNDGNRNALNAEVVQLITEMDRIANATSYNGISLLNGFGNSISEDLTASTALVSTTTGILDVSITGADSGNYIFIDSVNTDNEITLGNGIATQTIDIGPALDTDGAVGGIVATGSAIVANFDRLGIQLTLSGSRAATLTSPALDGYRDGELDGLTLTIEGGTGGSFQIGPDDGAVHRLEVNITDMRASGVNLNLSGVSIATLESSRGSISTIDLAIDVLLGFVVTSVRSRTDSVSRFDPWRTHSKTSRPPNRRFAMRTSQRKYRHSRGRRSWSSRAQRSWHRRTLSRRMPCRSSSSSGGTIRRRPAVELHRSCRSRRNSKTVDRWPTHHGQRSADAGVPSKSAGFSKQLLFSRKAAGDHRLRLCFFTSGVAG